MSLGSLDVDTYDLSCPFHKFRTDYYSIRANQGKYLKKGKILQAARFRTFT